MLPLPVGVFKVGRSGRGRRNKGKEPSRQGSLFARVALPPGGRDVEGGSLPRRSRPRFRRAGNPRAEPEPGVLRLPRRESPPGQGPKTLPPGDRADPYHRVSRWVCIATTLSWSIIILFIFQEA